MNLIQRQLLKCLQEFSIKINSKYISKKDIDNDKSFPSSSTFKRHFGSWGNAIKLAGLESGIITGRSQDPIIDINQTGLEIINGELLGDGCLYFSGQYKTNACFSHSTANIDYGEFLYNKLLSSDVPLLGKEYLPSKNGAKPQFRTRTTTNKYWTNLYYKWYKDGKKIIPDIKLTKNVCLHWFLGDGYFEGDTCKISTCSFTFEENKKLADLLTEMGFKATVNKRSGDYYIIRFSKYSYQLFLDWIGEPVKGYEHRWGRNH